MTTTRSAGLGTLAAAILAATLPTLAATPATVCVVRPGEVSPGLDPAILGSALALEARKLGSPLAVAEAADRAGCPAAAAILSLAPVTATLTLPGQTLVLDSREVDPSDRAQDLARRVVLALAPGAPPSLGIERPATVRAGPATAPAGTVAGYLLAAGRYVRESGLNAGAVDVEGGVSWFEERLTLGLAAGWQPPVPVPGAPIPATVQAIPVTVALRGGWEFRPVLLRAGLLAGLDLRRLGIAPPTRLAGASWWTTAPVLGGEVEVLFRVGQGWLVGLAGGIRGFGSWTDFRRDGTAFYRGPRVSGGVALRVGGVLAGRRP